MSSAKKRRRPLQRVGAGNQALVRGPGRAETYVTPRRLSTAATAIVPYLAIPAPMRDLRLAKGVRL